MSVTNPAPSAITSWGVEAGIRSFTVSIPVRPADNDLAGIIVIAKAGTQEPVFPDDVFYRGAWSDLIVVNTDADNNVLLPSQAYTVKVAAFDEFGTQSLIFSDAIITTTLQVVEDDLADNAVTNSKIPDNEIESGKIVSLIADKISAGTITGSTLQTAETGKRFVVSTSDNEAHFYGDRGDGTIESLCDIGIKTTTGSYDSTVIKVSTAGELTGAYLETASTYTTAFFNNTSSIGSALYLASNSNGNVVSRNTEATLRIDCNNGVAFNVEGGISTLTADPSLTPFTSDGVLNIINSKGSTYKALEVTQGTTHLTGGTTYFRQYAEANLPLATPAGGLVHCTDTSGGASLVYSDGTNWKRVGETKSGSWTPTINCDATAFSGTYTTQVGYYTKVDNIVTVVFKIQLASITGGVGYVFIDDLPFPVKDSATSGVIEASNIIRINSIGSLAGGTPLFFMGEATRTADSRIFITYAGGSAALFYNLDKLELTATTRIVGTVVYATE